MTKMLEVNVDKQSFAIGDRVRVPVSLADAFLLPERKFIGEGRLATVIGRPNPVKAIDWYRIEWDVKRKGAQVYRTNMHAKDMERVE